MGKKRKMNQDVKNISITPYKKKGKKKLIKVFSEFDQELVHENKMKESKNKQYIRQFNALKAKIEQLEKLVSQEKSTSSKANLHVRKLAKKKETLEKLIEKLKNNIVSRGEVEIKMKLDQWRQANKFSFLEKQTIEAKAQIKKITEYNIDLKQSVEKLQEELKCATTDFEKQINQSLSLEHKKTKTMETILDKERKEVQLKIERFETLQCHAKKRSEKLENQLNETKANMEQLIADMEKKSLEQEEIYKERNVVQKQLTAMTQQLKKKEQQIEKLSVKNRALSTERQNIQQKYQAHLQKSEEACENMKIDFNNYIQQEKYLKSQLKVITLECEKKETKIKKLNEQLELFDKIKKEMELLQEKLQHEMTKGKQMQMELEKTQHLQNTCKSIKSIQNQNKKVKIMLPAEKINIDTKISTMKSTILPQETSKGRFEFKKEERKLETIPEFCESPELDEFSEFSELDESSEFDNEEWTLEGRDEKENRSLKQQLLKEREKNLYQEEKIDLLVSEKATLAAKVVLTQMMMRNKKKNKYQNLNK